MSRTQPSKGQFCWIVSEGLFQNFSQMSLMCLCSLCAVYRCVLNVFSRFCVLMFSEVCAIVKQSQYGGLCRQVLTQIYDYDAWVRLCSPQSAFVFCSSPPPPLLRFTSLSPLLPVIARFLVWLNRRTCVFKRIIQSELPLNPVVSRSGMQSVGLGITKIWCNKLQMAQRQPTPTD